MNKPLTIFSDLDGTLCFQNEAHGVKEVRFRDKKYIHIPSNTGLHEVIDVSAVKLNAVNRVYMDVRTKLNAILLADVADIVLVTGARLETMKARSEAFNFQNGMIIENGGSIYDSRFNRDEEWHGLLEPERKALFDMRAELADKGFIFDDKGRTSALRVRFRDNRHKFGLKEEFQEFFISLQLPSELKMTSNLGFIDIILKSAGKGNAVRYFMKKKEIFRENTVAIGDDVNDIEMFEAVPPKNAYVLASGYPDVIKIAKERGWNVSEEKYFNGINKILIAIRKSIYNI